MGRPIEYEIKGKSDVEQVTGRAKKSMTSMQIAIDGLNKSFQNFGKNVLVGLLNPTMLLFKGIDMLTEGYKKWSQTAADGVDKIAGGESIFSSETETNVAKHFKKIAEDRKEGEDYMEERRRLALSILKDTDVGAAYLEELRKSNFWNYALNPMFKETMAADADVQTEAIRRWAEKNPGLIKPDVAAKPKEKESGSLGSGVIGVGQSIQDIAAKEQTDIQRAILETIRAAMPQERFAAPPDPLALRWNGGGAIAPIWINIENTKAKTR